MKAQETINQNLLSKKIGRKRHFQIKRLLETPVREATEHALDYTFSDQSLLSRALTHVSFQESWMERNENYQRLEFLGDRVLGLIVADMLYQAFPEADEGELSRRLASLVRRETCAEVAKEWGIGPYIRFGESEIQSGGQYRTATLGDVCEALIGAIFIDGGYTAARRLIEQAWRKRLIPLDPVMQDAKTYLQEWAQKRGYAIPTYTTLLQEGPDHAPLFTVAVHVASLPPLSGSGPSKRIAEQNAAAAFIEREKIPESDPESLTHE